MKSFCKRYLVLSERVFLLHIDLFISFFSYRSHLDVNQIEYRRFCDEIESVFTTDFLEKNPLVEAEQYIAIKDASNIRLDPDKEDRVRNLMSKLAERVSRCNKSFIFFSMKENLGSCTSFTSISIIRRFRSCSSWSCNTESILTCIKRSWFIKFIDRF